MGLPTPPPLDELLGKHAPTLFLDFDGTLVEIAPSHDAIEVPRRLPDALVSLRDRLDGRLALVSGRSLDNLEQHLGYLPIAQAGSHGADCRLADGTRVGETPGTIGGDVLAALETLAGEYQGLSLEAKSHGAALHYRANPDLEDRVIERAQAIARETDLSLKRGKCVVELVQGEANKGAAVETLMQHDPFVGSLPMFVGDDVTDEDGFTAVRAHGGFAIAVGERETQQADYHLASPEAVRDWLGL